MAYPKLIVKKVVFYTTQEQFDALLEIAKVEQTSLAGAIRNCIALGLEGRKKG